MTKLTFFSIFNTGWCVLSNLYSFYLVMCLGSASMLPAPPPPPLTCYSVTHQGAHASAICDITKQGTRNHIVNQPRSHVLAGA